MKDRLVIVIPAYNEEKNIRTTLEEWYNVIEHHNGGGKSRLLVINDGSTDGTEFILRKFAKTHPMFRYYTQKNQGHGAAIWTGYRMALAMKADYIFQTDSDGQTTSAAFPAFWAARKTADAVMGRRVTREDGKDREMISRILSDVIWLTFHVSIPDANCPYRLMSRTTLKQAMRLVPRNYALTNVLLSVAFEKQGREVELLPIQFRKRQGGENSLNKIKIAKIGCRSLYEFLKLNRIMNRRLGGFF